MVQRCHPERRSQSDRSRGICSCFSSIHWVPNNKSRSKLRFRTTRKATAVDESAPVLCINPHDKGAPSMTQFHRGMGGKHSPPSIPTHSRNRAVPRCTTRVILSEAAWGPNAVGVSGVKDLLLAPHQSARQAGAPSLDFETWESTQLRNQQLSFASIRTTSGCPIHATSLSHGWETTNLDLNFVSE